MAEIQIPEEHSISNMIDDGIVGVTARYHFPEDRPKYYTTINIEQYKVTSAPGGYRSAFAGIQDWTIKGLTAWVNENVTNRNPAAKAEWISFLFNLGQLGLPDSRAAPPVTTDSIILPLPVQLQDVHKVNWDEKPINPWAAALDLFGISGGPERQILGVFGLAPNYFRTMLFDRPLYKRHELTFKLAPRNFEEADRIADIIMVLNNAMAPGLGAGEFVFTFPNVVRVLLKPNAGFLFKFKPCVIEAISTNYGGSGGKKAFYYGEGGKNAPESVEITMMLCEVEYWLQGDFNRKNQ